MEELLTFNALAALATLAVLEIVLGIDNVVFLAILTGKLPVPRGYIYFSMAFSLMVEVLNLRTRRANRA